jgi:hypothetical protein
MYLHSELTPQEVRSLIRKGLLPCAGHQGSKIYGKLRCPSGKKMARRNRVFFRSFDEAKKLGYRPCGRCLRENYLLWRFDTSPSIDK